MAKAKKKFRITNYGNTRRFPYKGQFYEITKNGYIDTEDEQLAKEFSGFEFVDAVVLKQPVVKKKKAKKKRKKRKKRKTPGTSGKRRKHKPSKQKS